MSEWSSQGIADAWLRMAEARNRMMAAATERMFERAGVRPGARVLDLGTGTGDTALMMASRVGAAGSVVATDVSPGMAEAASRAVQAAGLRTVTVRAMDAQRIDLEPGSFDAAVARNVLMFLQDPASALAGVHRALRPGGRLAAVVWGPLEENPFNAVPVAAVRDGGWMPATTPEVVRAFSLSDAAALEASLRAAGFTRVEVERVPGRREFASVEEAVAHLGEPLYRELMAQVPDLDRPDLLARIGASYRACAQAAPSAQGCSFPMVSLVASGER